MITLKVEEMSCGHCAAAVEKAVRGVDPAAGIVVDLAAGTVKVSSAAFAGSIGDAIREAGYPNRPLSS